jgi:hypothetical protein
MNRNFVVGLVLVAGLLLVPALGQAQTGVLYVIDNKVGIGTNAPQAPLEINPASGFAAFRLNVTGQSNWAISNTGQVVTFNKIGSGGQETTFRTRLDGSGLPTFSVQGTVEGTQFQNSSSRELKTAFESLDTREVLSKLSEIPVTSWTYKSDPVARRHYGLIAEDFQAAFGLGDGKSISTVDAQGVAMAAIQGLHDMVLERDSQIEELRSEIEELKRLVASR